MVRFVQKLGLFALPFVIYAAFIAATDPFDFLFDHSLISEETKMQTSALIDPPLWKMNKFAKEACPNILLGDSRMGHVSTSEIRKSTDQQYVNLSYGGATLQEMIDTFWFATKHIRLRNVMIGINFNVYNDRYSGSRIGTYEEMRKGLPLYFLDSGVVKSAALGTYAEWFHRDLRLGVPKMTRAEFWQFQILFAARNYSGYERPKRYRAELEEVTSYCRHKAINCSFIIFPTHVDLQKVVKQARLTSDYEQFKRDLASMAATYDYDYESPLTMNAANFSDPFHFTDSVGGELVHEIWEGHLRYGRKLSPDNVEWTQAGAL